MAIDNAEKRRAVAGVPFLPLGPGLTANATKDVEWRTQAAWSYSGLAAFTAGGLGPIGARGKPLLRSPGRMMN